MVFRPLILPHAELEARFQGERPRSRIIQDPISRLNPEMLYQQIQYLVEEGDWAQQGEEVPVGGHAR
jgi:hypothetical protein